MLHELLFTCKIPVFSTKISHDVGDFNISDEVQITDVVVHFSTHEQTCNLRSLLIIFFYKISYIILEIETVFLLIILVLH